VQKVNHSKLGRTLTASSCLDSKLGKVLTASSRLGEGGKDMRKEEEERKRSGGKSYIAACQGSSWHCGLTWSFDASGT
jgi:hypothetical protein